MTEQREAGTRHPSYPYCVGPKRQFYRRDDMIHEEIGVRYHLVIIFFNLNYICNIIIEILYIK